ncbi:MurR/RpiR family transcriptional regulator [Brevibacterium sp. CFH 10365]|uniref:MurR/RpiR family transcriptional regulator n=1 Tax=Brevibacterium sp. CFH 10365 TaxID=2585207 RepID=UPI00187A8FFF|nr:MurR/RpiR family transcriptional regulator [Brevibacterium sp. CFH 10365]
MTRKDATAEDEPDTQGSRGEDGPSLAVGLRAAMSTFTPAEKKIARAILASYPFSGLEPISSLAETAGVSAPSVVRFARTLGFNGYREFQERLRQEIREREESNLSQAETRPRGQEPQFDAARSAYHAGIDQTFDSVIGDDLDSTVRLLAQIKRSVVFLGATYSGFIADIFHAQLAPARPGTMRLAANPLVAAGQLLDLKRGDVVVAFDVRRYEPGVTDVVRTANELGLTTIVFTDPWMSPAAALADHVLTADVRAAGPSDTMVPMLALVEAVSELVVVELGQAGFDRLGRLDPLRLRLGGSANRA